MALVDEIREQIKAAFIASPELQQAYGFDAAKLFDEQFSPTAIEAIDINIIAEAHASIITVMRADMASIQNIVDNNHIGTAAWYVALAKQFQWSETEAYQLVVDEQTGEIYYNIVNPADRIVTQASCVVSETSILVKVARGEPGNLQPLTDLQRLDLENYLRSLKIAGVKLGIVNEPADIVELTADIYYDPTFNTNLLKQSIVTALKQYSITLPYNGVVYRNAIIDAIQQVPGVADIVIATNGLEALHGDVRTTIERAYITYSGYFNFKDDSTFPAISFINNNE